jgi:signal peptidase I
MEDNKNYQVEEMNETVVEENTDSENISSEENEKEPIDVKKEIFSWIKIIVVAVVIAFVINNFIIMNANVPSGSMMNTIMKNDRMIGLRTSYWFSDPERGDIVIFENPDYDESSQKDDKYYVKRVIGLPGEKVVIKDAKIYINDSETPLDEPYLPEEWTYVNGSDEELVYNVPDGCYFMLGDNRNNSSDARFWNNTYLKRENVVAKAILRYWPWDHKGFFEKVDYAQ